MLGGGVNLLKIIPNFIEQYVSYFRKEVFLVVCPGNKRDKATLLSIIKEKVDFV